MLYFLRNRLLICLNDRSKNFLAELAFCRDIPSNEKNPATQKIPNPRDNFRIFKSRSRCPGFWDFLGSGTQDFFGIFWGFQILIPIPGIMGFSGSQKIPFRSQLWFFPSLTSFFNVTLGANVDLAMFYRQMVEIVISKIPV